MLNSSTRKCNILFGSISYLNLLPFQLFLKQNLKNSSEKATLHLKKNVPSQINTALKKRTIHAGFISSVHSYKYPCTNLGIIAHKSVYSVLLIEGQDEKDPASETSNKLAKVLGLKGKVLIGDEALKYYLEGKEAIDLSLAWHNKTKLPFVFAKLCSNKHHKKVKKLAQKFSQKKVKIPQYILKKEAKKRNITPQQLSWYLKHISYTMDWKSTKSLKKFLNN